MRIPSRLLRTALVIAFALNGNLSIAQVKFGPKGGLSFSELPNHTKYIIGGQQIYNGYHIGIIGDIRLYEQLFLQPGLFLSNTGSEYIVGNDSAGSTTGFSNFEFSSFYADIPLDLVYKFNMGPVKLLIIAGPQLGYGLSGKWTASYGTSAKVHFGNGPNDDLKPFDFGVNFGGGFEVARIQLSLQYYLGLATLSTMTPPIEEQKFKVLTVSIGYLFGNDERVYNDYKSKYLRKHKQNKAHWR